LKNKYFFICFFCFLFVFVFSNPSFAQEKYEYHYDQNNKLDMITEGGNLEYIIMKFIYDKNGNLIKKVHPLKTAPTLTVLSKTEHIIELSWNVISGANGYFLYQDGVKMENPITGNQYQVDLLPNRIYTFEISAFNEAGDGPKSNLVQEGTSIQAPSNLSSYDITENSVVLTWTAISGVEGYYIYQNGQKLAGPFTANIATLTLASDTRYSFEVTAFVGGTESLKSNRIQIKTLPLPPQPPTGLHAQTITSQSLNLTWDPVPGAISYYIYQKNPNTTMYTPIAETTDSYFDVFDLEPGTTYSFVVKAFNRNFSQNSNEVTVTTLNLPVSDTFEPNDTMATAYYFDPGRIDSFIYSASDIDYYKILAEVSGTIKLELVSPYQKDYDIYLYSITGQLLSSGLGINLDKITFNTNGGQFYIKIVGHNSSYSTSNVYSLDYQFTEGVGGGTYCPPGHVCTDEGESMLIFTSEKNTESRSSEPSSLPLTLEQSLILENLHLPEVTFDKKVVAYLLLSEIGAYGDIFWLEERAKITSDSRELRLIKWTMAKIGYKHSQSHPIKAFYYIATLLDEEDEEIQQWLYEKLIELTGDPIIVEKFLEKYKKLKEMASN
jgi:hypothetical protein